MTWQEDVARRVRRWKRKKAVLTPALWMVAGLAALMAWFGRRNA